MTLHSASVFQAICYRHRCEYQTDLHPGRNQASLVSISRKGARIQVGTGADMPAQGGLLRLAPRFLDDQVPEHIEARVAAVNGRDVCLAFTTPLPLPGARLCELTSR